MSTTYLIFYFAAIITALLGLAGLVILINGLTTQNKKLMWRGSILTGLTMVLIISAVFCGAHKAYSIHMKKCKNKKEMKCKDFDHSQMMMDCDSMMIMCMDSTMNGDSCRMTIEKKVIMHDKKGCDMSKCDPSDCMKECRHKE